MRSVTLRASARRWLPPLLLIAAALLATWPLTFGDRVIARGDLLLYFYPLRDFAASAVRGLRLPLWNPYTFMGSPFLANSQAGFFYPLNALLAWAPVERAVSWSIVLHLTIAALGAYAAARRGLGLGRLAAGCAALAFGLGGYLGAQVEHLNQLQVLAWLPWEAAIVLSGMRARPAPAPAPARGIVALSGLIALQVTAGHTQSLYICLVSLGLIIAATLAATPRERPAWACAVRLLLVLGLSGALAGLMTAAQLLPTIELAGESARAGGLSFGEVASFSWRPWVTGRALLPTYGDPLFPEYIAYLGASGIALALGGALFGRRVDKRAHLLALVLTAAGLILAFGVATPLFNLLYKVLPGFRLFRAQARWLVLFALAASWLIGLGVEALWRGLNAAQTRRWLLSWLGLAAAIAAAIWLGARLSLDPEYRSLPANKVVLGWALSGAAVTLVLALAAIRPRASLGLCAALAAELLIASQFQPYSRAADRDSITALRPATAHLLTEQSASDPAHGTRILSLSSLVFDPGDLPEQRLMYGPQLDADALYDRVITAKHKEILSPNLGMYYRLPSVDGYDGGLLPIRRYAEFTRQFAPSAKAGASDGRLREFLSAVPPNIWLEQMSVGSVIADKTQDVFIDSVFYDLQFRAPVSAGLAVSLTPYSATGLGLVFSATRVSPGRPLANALITFDDGARQQFRIAAPDAAALAGPFFGVPLSWAGHQTATLIEFAPAYEDVTLRGMTSIDAADRSFLPQPVRADHDMRLAHSGDVKIYENLRPAPRALIRSKDGLTQPVPISLDQPEAIELNATVPSGGPWTLILRDTCYPGWVARVDGAPTPIRCADVMFREIDLPAGPHQISFRYEPTSVRYGLMLSVAGCGLWILLLASTLRLRARPPTTPA